MYDDKDDKNGKNYNEKRSGTDVLFDLKRKYDNFWYQYKWYTLGIVILLITLIICISQCAGKIPGDANIAYIGYIELMHQEYSDIQSEFGTILGEDLNADEKTHVEFVNFMYMTATEVENARAKGGVINSQTLMISKQQIDAEIIGGDTVIYFLNPPVYRELKNAEGVFMPLEEALGYKPEYATDDYCFQLSNLECYEYFSGISIFPPETLVAVRNYQTTSDKESKDQAERYERNFKMLNKLIDFKMPSE